ncbi:uncharacterized protein DUF5051 [Vulcaniibacterium tengchongense]|uniref:Uncharacterized protein DUF5051 n=2 Tax=Vulcaniibacterium tengchongense TaxID=1273429 RepID=A0A3N4VH29_9GAMM|nr:uncharacterized protein DUF5051 [Vulcaniibacterium tengchongense]
MRYRLNNRDNDTPMPTQLFLDTEWADLEGEQLVSLALISADGQRRFYAERAVLPAEPTAFVKENVYPLLERGVVALPDAVFSEKLNRFLGSVSDPVVLYDYAVDEVMLDMAVKGFPKRGDPRSRASSERAVRRELVRDDLISMILEDWFLANPEEAARRHHAMVDANALRLAWLAASGLLDAPWSASWRQFHDQ